MVLLKGLAVATESLSACHARCRFLPRPRCCDVVATLGIHKVTSKWLVMLSRHRSSCLATSFSDRHRDNAWLAASMFDTLRSRPKAETQSLAVFTTECDLQSFPTPACSRQAPVRFRLDLQRCVVLRLQLKLKRWTDKMRRGLDTCEVMVAIWRSNKVKHIALDTNCRRCSD